MSYDISPFLRDFILSEVSQREKEKYWMISLMCGIWEMTQTNWFTNRDRLTDREQTYGCWGEEGGEGIIREFGIDVCTLLYIKWATNKDPLDSTGAPAQGYVAAWLEGEFGENGHMYVYESLCCAPERITTLLIDYTPKWNGKLKPLKIVRKK